MYREGVDRVYREGVDRVYRECALPPYLETAAFARGDAGGDVFLPHGSDVGVVEIELVHGRVVHQQVCDES